MFERNEYPKMWAKAAPSAKLQLALMEPDGLKNDVKTLSIFDEIFPAKASLSEVERGETSWHKENTFYKAMGPVLVAGQFFGVMPVTGLLGSDYTSLSFSWKAWRVFYSYLIMTVNGIMLSFCIGRILVDGIDIYRTTSLMFFFSSLSSLIFFLRISPKWPKICETIAKEELKKNPTYYQLNHPRKKKHSLRVWFSVYSFCIMFFALVEHVLSIISGIAVAYDCPTGQSSFHNYFINAYPQVFYFTNFSIPIAVFLQPVNFLATFNWNFMDLFIILMSITLTERFQLLGDRLDMIIGKTLPEYFWKAARVEFANLARLVRVVDENINKILLLSFANNLYFICLQLFNSLKQFRVIAHFLYFSFSFGFLFTRSLLVSLEAAKINSTAQRPAMVLYAVPSESYCVEVRRFLEQVTSDAIGLTGYNFFYVTRGLILTIAGTIVTYELVLVQFNSPPPPVTANLTITNGVDNCNVLGSK